MEVVKYGADIDFYVEVANMDRTKFQVFEDGEALAVLDVISEHLILRKFIGCFAPDVTSWNGHDFLYCPLFTLQKTDSTIFNPKHRTIFNAAAERPRTKFQQDVLDGLYDEHPDFLEF